MCNFCCNGGRTLFLGTIQTSKRFPWQVEASKKAAAAAKNFKEAGSLAKEAKGLEARVSEAATEVETLKPHLQTLESTLEDLSAAAAQASDQLTKAVAEREKGRLEELKTRALHLWTARVKFDRRGRRRAAAAAAAAASASVAAAPSGSSSSTNGSSSASTQGLTASENATVGFFASAFATVATEPIDVIRTRLMAQAKVTPQSLRAPQSPSSASHPSSTPGREASPASLNMKSGKIPVSSPKNFGYRGLFDGLQKAVSSEGIASLYRGLLPRLLLKSLGGSIWYTTYSWVRAEMERRSV